MAESVFRLANLLYRYAFPVYRPLYAAYKAWTDRNARAQLQQLIKPGMTVFDVGANIGVYTRLLSNAVGASGAVVAFEPSPENYRRLLEGTRGLRNVTVVNAAVGESTGRTRLYMSNDLNVDHRTYDPGGDVTCQEVAIVRLDDWVVAGKPVDFIKIDVQGYELHVLRGAERVLRENPRLHLYMEFWPYGLRRAGVEPRDVLDFVNRLGFFVLRIDGSPFAAGELDRLVDRVDRGYFDCLVVRNANSLSAAAAC